MAKKGRIKKRPYCSPKITRVDLKSEEAVLAACKTDSQGGSITYGTDYAPDCKYHSNQCNEYGS